MWLWLFLIGIFIILPAVMFLYIYYLANKKGE